MSEKLAKYRSSLKMTGIGVGYSVAGAAAVILVIEKGSPDWLRLFYTLLITAVLTIAVVLVCYKVEVSLTGIRGHNVWGRRRFVPWPMMRSIKCINLGGLRYLRVFTGDGAKPLWLPLSLHSQEAFEDSVKSLAPDGNVVRAFFEETGAEQITGTNR